MLLDQLSQTQLYLFDSQSQVESLNISVKHLTDENEVLCRRLSTALKNQHTVNISDDVYLKDLKTRSQTDSNYFEYLQSCLSELQSELNLTVEANRNIKKEMHEMEKMTIDIKLKYAESQSTCDELAFSVNNILKPKISKLENELQIKDQFIETLKKSITSFKTTVKYPSKDSAQSSASPFFQTPLPIRHGPISGSASKPQRLFPENKNEILSFERSEPCEISSSRHQSSLDITPPSVRPTSQEISEYPQLSSPKVGFGGYIDAYVGRFFR